MKNFNYKIMTFFIVGIFITLRKCMDNFKNVNIRILILFYNIDMLTLLLRCCVLNSFTNINIDSH